ncbi:putative PurR-regulated permease PerM [Pedobacter cryoconitis]|uniref:Putative PurR-regulated permease PerM n=1 Tax=Pedobacter cryoconitis TaxID=188932 RepID=A0A7W9DZ50_9SPHI|nr:AI-2E family transporter [Pedobacter cryoconitis]MBB5636907.1 putative PurR-regulated permease PerM [Pedobacter cryoconitis]MBB6271308.1 putative PurR-regulated permease PerM [Pedobacter cryoconitis]
MNNQNARDLYKLITSVILYIFGLVILLWFLYQIVSVFILSIFAVVLGLIINQPVSRLEKKGMKRWLAALIILGTIFIASALLGFLIVPHISEQIDTLVGNVPGYFESISNHVSHILRKYPELNKELQDGGMSISAAVPTLGKTVLGLGSISFTVIGGIFLFIVFISMIIFFVGNPRPVVNMYLSVFEPEKRLKAERALQHTSVMLGGWMKSNLIGGMVQAVLVYVFLTIMNVPGALVWAALAFFSELIPKIGFYIMAIPPTLVALSVSPVTAFWCLIFFLLLNELISDFVMPKLRSSTMNIHPVSLLFLLLAMTTAFGLLGALLAAPMAAIIKAYYEEFYLKRFPEDPIMEQRIDNIINV